MSPHAQKSVFPPQIRTVSIVSPAGLPDTDALHRSIATLRGAGLTVKLGRHALEYGNETYYASDAEGRASDFNEAIHDRETDLILCARGGYGSANILRRIDFNALKTRNLPVLGYSDITAIHFAMLRKRAGRPVAAPMATHFFEHLADEVTFSSFRKTLAFLFPGEGATESDFSQEYVLRPVGGAASGRKFRGGIIPANLSVAASLCGTEFLPPLDGAVLVLEDVHEEPRKIDRALMQLYYCGLFDSLAALVFGQFTRCGGKHELRRIFERIADLVECPVFSGFPFGHDIGSVVIPCGVPARIARLPKKARILF